MPIHLRHALGEQILQGLLNGLAFCLLAYSLIQWVTQRDRMFGFYALVVLGSAGLLLQFFGIGPQYLWPNNPGWTALRPSSRADGAGPGRSFSRPHTGWRQPQRPVCAHHARGCRHHGSGASPWLGWLSIALGGTFMSLAGALPSLISLPAALARVRQKDLPIGATLLVAWVASASLPV